MAAMSPEVVSAAWLTPGGPGPGARFSAHNKRGPYDWTVTCTVIAFDPWTDFAWAVGDPLEPSSTWAYELKPDAGGTRVSERFCHGPAMSWVRHMVNESPSESALIVARRQRMLEDDMRLTLQEAASILDVGAPTDGRRQD